MASSSVPAPAPVVVPKKRGSYNCGRCGLPKKGHVCPVPGAAPKGGGEAAAGELKPRRALHFDDDDGVVDGVTDAVPAAAKRPRVDVVVDYEDEQAPWDGWVELGAGRRVPGEVVVEVLRRLRADGVRPVAGLLVRCPALTRLVLRMDSDVDATMFACIAFSFPNLQTLDISMANGAVNRITGDELTRFVSEKRSLSVLKLEGCTSLGFLNINSSSLSTLWLSGLCSLSKAAINCSNLNELSLGFPKQNNDSTDLIALVDGLGRTCQNLRNMHISSIHLCNEAVFALESANLRGLSMLSLILGSKITDAAVASIVRSCASLELLDLSGSNITDNGLGMICKSFPHTLTRLLLALCPNITTRGVQAAATQLSLLRLMDCSKSMCVKPQPESRKSYFGDITGGIKFCSKPANQKKQQATYEKLIIKHANLKKLSLWGCSAIDALYVNCPELADLNLNSCTNLHPERLLLQCPNLKDVHVSGCLDMQIGAIRSQVLNEFTMAEPRLPCKRLADGSKRVHVPHFMLEQHLEEDGKWGGSRKSQSTVHLT